MDLSLQSVADALDAAERRLRAGSHAAPRIWPTGFEVLDSTLNGGFRSGELVLLGGPQGLGKTTFALQVARNVARAGRSVVFFSFEHDSQTLLQRLIAMEAGEAADLEAPGLHRIRSSFEAADGRSGSLVERLADTVGGVEAVESLRKYSDRLVLHRSSGSSTALADIRDGLDEVRRLTGQLPLAVVDYLQKVRVGDSAMSGEDRVTRVVEGLKDLALDFDVPVLAVVAADKSGLNTGKRLRVADLRGSSALAYEADTVLILNNKQDIVARHHLVYDLGNVDRFRSWAVLCVEKNRSGLDQVDLEFRKRFEHSRFDPDGHLVKEKLVDERIFVE